jgi:hypothetical protein
MSIPKDPRALVHPFKTTLQAFLDDLEQLEVPGLQPDQCNQVVACFDAIKQHLGSISSLSDWLRDLLPFLNSFRAGYYTWNNPNNETQHHQQHRAEQYRSLRELRRNILPRYSYGSARIKNEERIVFIKSYDELIKLELLVPNDAQPKPLFKKAVSRAKEKRAAA